MLHAMWLGEITIRHRQVAAGRFREDPFYRLNVFSIAMPPLRGRGADVEFLAHLFTDRYCARIGKPRLELTADCLRRLRYYHWPGNVRELENVIERGVIIARDRTLSFRTSCPWIPCSRFVRAEAMVAASCGPSENCAKWSAKQWSRRSNEPDGKVAGEQGAARALGFSRPRHSRLA